MSGIVVKSTARAEIERVLQDAILKTTKAASLTQSQREIFRHAADSTSARLIRTISSCLAAPNDGSSLTSATPRPLLSPYLRPLPAPPVDAEVVDLQTQLSAACQRVAALRATVPSQLTQRLTEHLRQCRPTEDIPEAQQLSGLHIPPNDELRASALGAELQHVADFASDPASEARTGPDSQTAYHGVNNSLTPLSPAPADLQSMYVAAVQRMPALRAKLEEALQRMDRVVHAMESDSVHASPYTADLAGQLTDEIAETASPALQQALQSGKVVTRRQLTKYVNPVPYAS